jgi:glyoxylase-like metal-dependent hydrolase (beta-lactamase superfamily II)
MISSVPQSRRDQVPERGDWPVAIAEDLAYLRTAIVNVYFFGLPGAGDRGWVLIDAGMPGSARAIAAAAGRRFGPGGRPAAIVLTHGHFDHVGALEELAAAWGVPVFAHELELPYLTGRSPYPPPDPTVGGGLMAALSWTFPRGPIDLGERVRRLPEDGSVPGMPGWRWVHTPGHAPGHVSLFRDADRALVAGDAFVTVKQESALAVLSQRPEVHGPPAYYTIDWAAARHSVEVLASLEPHLAATGHGIPLRGDAMLAGLRALARDFDRLAVPEHGRYVHQPAITGAGGIVALPPDVPHPLPKVLLGLGAGLAAGLAIEAMFHPGGVRNRRDRS